MNSSCPNCRSRTLVPLCGGGVECLSCDYKEMKDDLERYAELIASVPGTPLLTGAERHEDETRRTRGLRSDFREGRVTALRLAQEAARRHGVSLEDLRVDMRNSKSIPGYIRWAFQAVICDLAMSGLGDRRIAGVLHKGKGTITKSTGLARARARRKQATLHREVVGVMSEYRGRTPNVIVRKFGHSPVV